MGANESTSRKEAHWFKMGLQSEEEPGGSNSQAQNSLSGKRICAAIGVDFKEVFAPVHDLRQ